jgi:hypothetical protein
MGMQGEEFAWRLPAERQPDADEDGVPRELSVGDVTALTIYNASQETPHGVGHLVELGMVARPDAAALARVEGGRASERIAARAVTVGDEAREHGLRADKRGNGHLDFLASRTGLRSGGGARRRSPGPAAARSGREQATVPSRRPEATPDGPATGRPRA